jgi:dihydroorotate dehydrogenase (fumarate)
MDLRTRYLGLELAHPFVCGSSPLVDDLDAARRLEDDGAAAVVLRSLFEEQIEAQGKTDQGAVEAAGDRETIGAYADRPDAYLEHIRRLKEALSIPVVASLNGASLGGWLSYARRIEEAGADALELNVHRVVTDPSVTAFDVEDETVEIVTTVSDAVFVPVAVKISPYHTALAHFASRLEAAGAAALVIFNRFHEPDLELEELQVKPELRLSDSSELLLRLRWLAILRGRLRISLVATGGAHSVDDAVKALACGADAIQMVSELLQNGSGRLGDLRSDLERWLEEHEFEGLDDLVGCLSLDRSPAPESFGRAQYVRLLHGWRLGAGAEGR